MKIAFIGCCKQKLKGTYQTQDLYISPLFRRTLEYCRIRFDKIYILSAKHGLLKLTQIIDHYDLSLNNMTVEERMQWSVRVLKQLSGKIYPGDEIHLFCGEKYYKFLLPGLVNQKCFIPLEGLGIGQRLRWFKQKERLVASL